MTAPTAAASDSVLLVAAVSLETDLLRREIAFVPATESLPFPSFTAEAFGHRLTLVHSGIGKAGAAAAVAAALTASPASRVLSFGVGGAYPGRGLGVGDLALAEAEIFGDEGVLAPQGFLDMEALGLPLLPRDGHPLFNRFPVATDQVVFARPILEKFAASAGRHCACGPFVTVSSCSGTTAAAAALSARTGGLCENMEGAAVAQVCALYRRPFLELRGISNLTEDRDLSRWDLAGAAEMAQRAVLALLAAWNAPKEERCPKP